MKKILFAMAMLFSSFLLSVEAVDAATDNFVANDVTVENDANFEFEDCIVGDVHAIRSTNTRMFSSSSITIKFSGRGTISFDYMFISEYNSETIYITIDDIEGSYDMYEMNFWYSFEYYSDTEAEKVISVRYERYVDSSNPEVGFYLANLEMDRTPFVEDINFTIDGTTYDKNAGFVYYDLENKQAVLTLEGLTEGYTVDVILNGESVYGNDFSYDLGSSEHFKLNNNVSFTYNKLGCKPKTYSFNYYASLNSVIQQAKYENDKNNPYEIIDRNGNWFLKSTNTESGSAAAVTLEVEGSGKFYVDYIFAGRKHIDEFVVIVIEEGQEEVIVLKDQTPTNELEHFVYEFKTEGKHVILLGYAKATSNYTSVDDCVYISRARFEEMQFVELPTIKLEGSEICDGIGGEWNADTAKLTFESMSETVSVVVRRNGNEIEYDEDQNAYILPTNGESNSFELVFSSSLENVLPMTVRFYLFNRNMTDVFGFVNDENNPYVREIHDNVLVASSKINYNSMTKSSEITHTADSDEIVRVFYKTVMGDLDVYLFEVNGKTISKISGNTDWNMKEVQLRSGDVLKLKLISSETSDYSEVSISNIEIVDVVFANIVSGKINDVSFDLDTDIIEFDSNTREHVLTFDVETSAKVYINEQMVSATEGEYVLNSYINRNNVVEIVFSESEGTTSYKKVIYYNEKLINIDGVESNKTNAFVKDNIDDKEVISLNKKYDQFNSEVLKLTINKKGLFKFSLKAKTYGNLNMIILVNGEYLQFNEDFRFNDWNGFTVVLEEEINTVEFIVNASIYYPNEDLLYVADFGFVDDDHLFSLVKGAGTGESAFDFTDLIQELRRYSYSQFVYDIYKDLSVANESIFILPIEGFNIRLNGIHVEGLSVVLVELDTKTKNSLVITDKETTIVLNFYYKGVYGTSITEGYGSESRPYKVNTEAQLNDVRHAPSFNYALMNNITLTSNWSPIGSLEKPFKGKFDGNGYRVSNIHISNVETEFVGFFGVVANATIINLKLSNISINNGIYVGALAGGVSASNIHDIEIDNVEITLINSKYTEIMAGGLIGYAYDSNINRVTANNGLVSLSSDYISSVGGIIGAYQQENAGNVSNIITSINVEGNGYVAGVVGYAPVINLSYVVVSGNVKLLDNYVDGAQFGAITSSHVKISNAIHTISGTYESDDEVIGAKVFGMNIVNNGQDVDLTGGNFEVAVILNDLENDFRTTSTASFNGYVIRFELTTGFKYYEVFDFNNNEINSTLGSTLNLNDMTLYDSVEGLTVEQDDSYSEALEDDVTYSNHLTVHVTDGSELEALSYVINYGIPTQFGSFKVKGTYNQTLNLYIDDNIQLSDQFKGLGNTKYYPYRGNINGNNKKIKLTDNLGMNSGFINYYFGSSNGTVIKNLVLEGQLSANISAGFIANVTGGSVLLENIVNNATYNAKYTGALIACLDSDGVITVRDVVNNAAFNKNVFINTINGTIQYDGINKNYGTTTNGEKLDVSKLFFNTDAVSLEEAKLENYYTLDVGYQGIELFIDEESYISDENGLIRFVMSNVGEFYKARIENNVVKTTEIDLSPSLNSKIDLPKSTALYEDNSYSYAPNKEFILKGVITYYDETTELVDLTIENLEGFINDYELIAKEVELIHDLYLFNEKVTLTKVTEKMASYKEAFDALETGVESFRDQILLIQTKYNELNSIYGSDQVTTDTKEYYNNYMSSNNITKADLNAWLDVAVDHYSLVTENAYLTYGDIASFEVKFVYMSQREENRTISFDYTLEDILEDRITITTSEKVTIKNGDTVVFDEYLTAEVLMKKRILTPILSNDSFEYDGTVKEVTITYDLADKFDDKISNVIVKYSQSGIYSELKDAGIYAVEIAYELTNAQYYDLSEMQSKYVEITAASAELVWEGTFELTYSGINQLDNIKAYFVDVNDEKVYLDLNLETAKDVGEYTLVAVNDNENYIVSNNEKNLVINKANLKLYIEDYFMGYTSSVPQINVVVEGLKGEDNAETAYSIFKDDVEITNLANIPCDTYDLVVVLINENELSNNYNIEYMSGTLTVAGVDTKIVVDSEIQYEYTGYGFDYSAAKAKVFDANDNEVENPVFTFEYRNGNEIVDSIINVGTYTVKFNFVSTGTYNASSKEIVVRIVPATVTVKINDATSEYGNSYSVLSFEVVEGNAYSKDDIKVILSKELGKNVGEYQITGTSTSENYDVTFINGKYTITKRKVSITIDSINSAYLAEIKPLTYHISDGSVIGSDELNITLEKEEGITVGNYEITATYSNDNYELTFTRALYTITPIDIKNIEFDSMVKDYDGVEYQLAVSSDTMSDGSKADVKFYVQDSLVTGFINAGTYLVKAVVSAENYNTLELEAQITINAVNSNLGYEDVSEVYEFNPEGISYELSEKKFADGRDAYITYIVIYEGNEIVDTIDRLGNYVVTATIRDNLGNYNLSTSTKIFTVVQKNISIVYGETIFEYNGQIQYPTFAASENVEITYRTVNNVDPIDAGEYVIKLEISDTNYKIINDVMNYRIEACELTYENFGDSTKVYDSLDFNNNIKATNVAIGDSIQLKFEYYKDSELVQSIVDVGTYEIRVVGILGESADNYKLNEDSKMTLTVIPREIKVIIPDLSKTYGDEDPALEYTISPLLYNDDVVTGSLAREEGENVGQYKILIGTLAVSDNYELIMPETVAKLVIKPREIKYSYDHNIVLRYNGLEQKLPVEIEGEAHARYVGSVVNVGTYTIEIVVDSDNYCLPDDYEDIEVSILKRDVGHVISIEVREFVYNGQAIVPVASCGGYECTLSYYSGEERISDIIYPGKYNVRVQLETNLDIADEFIEVVVDKMAGTPKQVTSVPHFNKIVVELDYTLEYKIGDAPYTTSNVFTGLNPLTEYTISVRTRETGLAYASEPVVYTVTTTADPSEVNEMIGRLTDKMNEENIALLKEISEKLKAVNENDVDENKLTLYKNVKYKFNGVKDSYEANIETSSKIAKYLELRTMLYAIIIPLAIMFIVRRKANRV